MVWCQKMIEALHQKVIDTPEYCLILSVDSAEENIETAFQVAKEIGYMPSEEEFYAVTSFASDLVLVLNSIGAEICEQSCFNEGATGPPTNHDLQKMSKTDALKYFNINFALLHAEKIFDDLRKGYAKILQIRHALLKA